MTCHFGTGELLEWCRWTRASPDDVHFQVPLVTYRVIQVQPDPPPPQRPLTYFEKQLLSARLKVDGVRREAKMIDDYRNRVVLTKQVRLLVDAMVWACASHSSSALAPSRPR